MWLPIDIEFQAIAYLGFMHICIINLSMKEGCLFVLLYLWDPPNHDVLYHVSWSLWKALEKEGCINLVHDVWTCTATILEYWMISSLKIKLNRSWNFQRNWNVPLVFLERSWRAGFNGICLVRFGFKMWEVLIFKWFLSLKIQTNSQKPGFGRKNQLRTW